MEFSGHKAAAAALFCVCGWRRKKGKKKGRFGPDSEYVWTSPT
jgi:hypothetical protein